MGVCVSVLKEACAMKIEEVATTIEGEMKSFVGGGHSRSGLALGAIHIENTGQFSRFVGGTGGEGTLHLYYLNEGNGGKGTIIRSTREHDRKGRQPGKLHLTNRRRPPEYAEYVHGYDGKHFVEEIASRHGG